MLHLTRPLIWLDVETHDKVPPEQAYICELGFELIDPIEATKIWSAFIKPPVPIAEGATGVHNITNEMVADARPFAEFAKNLAYGFSNCDFGGYNVRFDLRVIKAEMDRAGVAWDYRGAFLVDPLRLWQVTEPRTLSDAVRHFCKRAPSDAHRALADAQDAREVADGILAKYTHLPLTVPELHRLCFAPAETSLDPDNRIVWVGPDACLNFGKWKGKPLRLVSSDYLQWILSSEFSSAVKEIVEAALRGTYPKREV